MRQAGGVRLRRTGCRGFAVRYLCTHHYFRIDKAHRELGWRPRVPLAEAIVQTASAFG